ncbi:hypothetical protein D9619_011146 [Psilocybe cf. subviscida]|uniref:DUF6589 domain-containing protein n=1 Tax=Psilocybe cf. subviscida TaxID=2480587 RepID=A0A8H5F5G1_9AGAR|nr:hypothetical protein D9619_011146 [Psilocybe cf. subviscida]
MPCPPPATSSSLLEPAITALKNQQITFDSLLNGLLDHPVLAQPVSENAATICEKLYKKNNDGVFSWAFDLIRERVCCEVLTLTEKRHGLHFNATKAKTDQLEGAFIQSAAEKMRKFGPCLWSLIGSLLNPDRKRRRRATQCVSQEDTLQRMGSSAEMDLDEIGDYTGMTSVETKNQSSQVDDDGSPANGESADEEGTFNNVKITKEKRKQRAAERNDTLDTVKAVVSISIFMQNANENCNYLQSVLGFFFHSTAVPEKVIETLAHAGLSISLTSIHRAIKSLSSDAAQAVRGAVRTLKAGFAYDNFDSTFKVSEPTVQHRSIFVSATSATVIPLYDVVNAEVLRCSNQLWEKDPLNPRKSVHTVMIDYNNLGKLHEDNPIFNSIAGPGELDDSMAEDDESLKDEDVEPTPYIETNAWHIRNILIEHGPACLKRFSKENGQPKPINQIPVHQTTQIPCRAMNIKESTADGNIEVIETLLRQGGIGDPRDAGFDPANDVDMSEYVVFAHGDLLTKERVESAQKSRRIEDTPKRRFQFVVFIPGLFHFKMAAADAIWRTWVQPVAGRKDPNSLSRHIGILRPEETGKFASKPGFRRMHDVIHHDIWASMLDCWKLEVAREDPRWVSLNAFAHDKPSWDLIIKLSNRIARKHIGTTHTISDERFKPLEKRDIVNENQLLRNRDELLYLELSHAMNNGDIGRVEATFLPWVYMFRATGKHKYAAHTVRFMFHLREFYPPELAQLIRMNWLCNPTGKPGGFRGVDWLVERNNLYTKVIYGGSGSNRTIDRIIEESILIEHFRTCHITVENGFHLQHRTIHHAKPDMTRTLEQLGRHFDEVSPHLFNLERKLERVHAVPDQVEEGINSILETGVLQDTSTVEAGTHEQPEVEADDLAD